ncbi:fatty acid desaturase [Hydrocarboniclastica marina]|uniref:Fatty acid desaturase n=1 Tax=Hydrocarboniclastica marina TaxID=2259620 RepID=A0A4P7XHQ9_9ALTE|nr:fatty acid desaturase [Hydrocarboniclastica marina]QCF25357.1 fatty acid desaturase [Hydrocarboniclastica marina]
MSADTRNMTDAEKMDYIRKNILEQGRALRRRHPWLEKHQNLIGATIMAVSLLGMIASGTSYVLDLIPWWVCVPVTAIFASLIHELEHDLIHLMYFKNRPWANDLMLALGWLARASTISPFVRRKLHLHHHKFSGTESDLEERGITNGERWGVRRLLMTGDNMMAVLLRPFTMQRAVRHYIRAQKPASRDQARKMSIQQLLSYAPLGNIYYLLFHSWIVAHLVLFTAQLSGNPLSLSDGLSTALAALDTFAVVYMLPSFLRTFCLHFISSNMHYYGDVEPRNVMQQCQVLNPWWLLPMQVFCFNFGSTHAIHHFAVREPFYIRQWTAPAAHKVMREMGVRFNDYGTFLRGNRFYKLDSSEKHQPEGAPV